MSQDAPVMRLDPEQLLELAELVADRLAESRRVVTGLVGVREVAAHLGVDTTWVYEHAAKLGARRLGDGPKARLRFNLAEVDERLASCSVGRQSEPVNAAQTVALRRRPPRSSGTNVELLPIRGLRLTHSVENLKEGR